MSDAARPKLDESALDALPVFPLPRVVLFPGGRLPLHLFEPRYRAMITDCMGARGPKAMAIALLQPGWQADYEGRPAVHEIAGAGVIVDHEELPDGTHNIVLEGVARVALEELPDDGLLYRRARARILQDVEPEGGIAESDRTALLSTATSIAAEVRRTHTDFALGLEAANGPGRIADIVADRLIADAELRQCILETLDVTSRVRSVTHALVELLALVRTQLPRRAGNAD